MDTGSCGFSTNFSEKPENFRSGFVAIVGRANVGKSTLLNRILDYKVSIVTPKPQTTRKSVLGILTKKNYQIVFIDTPGLHSLKKRGIYEYMLKAIYRAISEADIIVYMTDATMPVGYDETFLNRIQRSKVSKILAINKIDLVKKNELLPKIDHFSNNFKFDEIVPISALSADGVGLLVSLIAKHLPEGPPYFSDDQITDQNERFIAAEIVREKLFMVLKHELPYAVAVDVEEFKERSERLVYIRACIVVEKDSQKPIVIGHGGSILKRVGQLAREELEMLLSKRVFLELFVKVEKDWTKDARALRMLGFSKT